MKDDIEKQSKYLIYTHDKKECASITIYKEISSFMFTFQYSNFTLNYYF